MTYDFEDVETGAPRELQMHHSKVPPIGAVITVDGRKLRRLPSVVAARVAEDLHFTSHQLPKNWAHAKQHNPDGTCRFGSHAEVREAIAKARDNGEAISYGESGGVWGRNRARRIPHGEE